MEKTIEIILLSLNICFLLYLAFFKSYFKEKGKNLATKEDIGEITGIIEQIKANFSNETESIKHELQFINQKRITLLGEERNAILGYYDSCFCLYSSLINIFFTRIDEHFEEEIIRIHSLMNKLRLEYSMALGRMHLYFFNSSIIDAESEYYIKTINLENLIVITMIDLNMLNQLKKIDEVGPFSPEKPERLKDHYKKENERIELFYSERNKIHTELYPKLLDIRGILVNRLEEILK